jgi:microcystin-dependent protein
MACNTNCFINCDNPTSDQCVIYTGPDIPAFGICQGDQLSSVEVVLLQELQSALEGTGIEPEGVTLENCSWLADQFIGKDPNLSNLLQLIVDSSCSLKGMIDSINAKLAPQLTSFNTLCLQGLPANPTSNDILQSVITLVCTTNNTITTLPDIYVKNSDLTSLIQQQIALYLTNSSSGQVEYYQYFPLKVAFPYFGDLSGFDSTGKGLDASGMKNLYIANGLNGTPDLRGRTIVGAVRNVPGAALDAAVDPTNPNNPNWASGDRNGENTHSLTTNEIPSHTHGVNDPGHTHSVLRGDSYSGHGDQGSGRVGGGQGNNPQTSATTGSSKTGITLASVGGSQAHNNVQPSIAANWIIRML